MATLHRVLAAGVASLALTAGALATAAPAHAIAPTPLEALQAAVAAPVAAFPDRAQVRVTLGAASERMRMEGRVGQSAKRAHLTMTMGLGGQTVETAQTGYNGTQEYASAEPGDLSSAQRAALAAAGKPGPYLLLDAPSPWDPGMADALKMYAPITVATSAAGTAAPDDVDVTVLPNGTTLFRVESTSALIDVVVDRAGRFVHMWAQTPSATYESELLAWGTAVDLGYPKGYSAVSAADVSAAVAAYPRNVATAAVAAKAAAVAKKVNRWAKKKHVAVTKKVVKKRAAKAISGYTVRKFSKGVKLSRAYPPAGSVSRCIVAKKRSAVVTVC